MIIAVIGAGRVGRAIGQGWKSKGHSVLYGTVNPSADDEKHVKAAADAADVIAITVPWDAVADVCGEIGPQPQKIIIDCTNPVVMGGAAPVDKTGHVLSGAEQVQALRPETAVFKSLNQTGFETMANASAYTQRLVMFVAGDDAEKKATVMTLVNDLHFEAVDAGPLSNAGRLEDFAKFWIDLAFKRGLGRNFAFALVKKS